MSLASDVSTVFVGVLLRSEEATVATVLDEAVGAARGVALAHFPAALGEERRERCVEYVVRDLRAMVAAHREALGEPGSVVDLGPLVRAAHVAETVGAPEALAYLADVGAGATHEWADRRARGGR